MDFWRSINGMLELELTSADVHRTLQEISAANIPVYHISHVSDLVVRFQIRRVDHKKVIRVCQKRNKTPKICHKQGVYWVFHTLLRRPILLAGCLLFLCLMLYVPTRIFFVRVEGNHRIPSALILEAADQAGIHFGAARREVRSEKIKNTLLDAVPQLQWAGVNTFGCVAVISVRERSPNEQENETYSVSSIVSAIDGRVYACTATRGTLLCKEGDMVRKGQTLISGYTDCGLCIQATQAEGEIYAETARFVTALTPAEYTKIQEIDQEQKNISLLIGKKRINLWKDSGNWDATCGRMYKEYYMTLPGGFQLPLGICVETIFRYRTAIAGYSNKQAQQQLSGFARQYVAGQMVAGSIRTESVRVIQDRHIFRLEGSYACTEMIGRVQREQIGEDYGKSD